MTDQHSGQPETIAFDSTEFVRSPDNLKILAHGIGLECVAKIAENSPSLRKALPGFRHDHLRRVPRGIVDRALSTYAYNSEAKSAILIRHWLHSGDHSALVKLVAEKVAPDRIRPTSATILAEQGASQRDALLCALLLDDRAEVREGITQEFRQELLNANSELVIQAEELFQENERIRAADRELNTAKAAAEEANRKLIALQKKLNELELRELETQQLLDSAQGARKTAENARDEYHADAERAQARQREAELENEDLKEQITILRSELELTNRAQERVVELEAANSQLEDLNKKAANRYRHLEKEHNKIQRALDDERKHPRYTVSLAMLDESWHEALTAVAIHLRVSARGLDTMHSQESKHDGAMISRAQLPQPATFTDRARDWNSWQQMESEFAKQLIESPQSDFIAAPSEEIEAGLAEAGNAQKLLAMRWYLLEGFRLRLLQALENRILANINSDVQVVEREGSAS